MPKPIASLMLSINAHVTFVREILGSGEWGVGSGEWGVDG